MALEQRLTPRMQQKLVMTPALQLAIKLLQLNKLELEQTLQQEMVENPVLEEREFSREEEEEIEAQEADEPEEDLLDDYDFESYVSEYYDSSPTVPNMREEGKAPPIENTLTEGESLTDHLRWQLEMSDCDEREGAVGEAIIGNLNPDGYLRASPAEIAAMGGWDRELVERALERVREFDPPGIAAADLRECLLQQLRRLDLEEELAATIVRDHFDALSSHRYKEIARECRVELDGIADAIELIQSLNPKPGRAYDDETTRYIVPDVFVVKDGDGYVVNLNEDGLPKLRVSRLYRRMLQSKNGLSEEAASFLQEKLRSALWLIKSYGQRQRTIRKVAESIVAHQSEFLDQGVSALTPMVLRDVADDIEMHESTVSRVVNGKYMHTPQGIYEMKFFFHSGLDHASGEEVSSVSVKERLRKIVENEDSRKPLSDAAIARELKEGGLKIARRTVAKYREELGIPASKARRALR